MAPAKECYGQGARGLRRPRSLGGEETRELKLGVGGQGSLPGGDHGGGGHKGAEQEHPKVHTKLDLKLPKCKDTGMYIFRGEIGYNNTKQMEGYKVMNMINKYEGMGKKEELSLDIAKEYSFGKSVGLVEELESSSSSPAKRRKLTPPTGPQQPCGRPSSTPPWAASPTTRSPGPGSRWRKSRALDKQQSLAGRSFLERNILIPDPAVENSVLSDGIETE